MSMRPDGLIACDDPGCDRTVSIHRTTWEGALEAGWALSEDAQIGSAGVDHCPNHQEEAP